MSTAPQQRLATREAPADHLSAKRPTDHGNPIEKDCEWHCLDCNSRITISPDDEREYGHFRQCDHRLPRGDGQ